MKKSIILIACTCMAFVFLAPVESIAQTKKVAQKADLKKIQTKDSKLSGVKIQRPSTANQPQAKKALKKKSTNLKKGLDVKGNSSKTMSKKVISAKGGNAKSLSATSPKSNRMKALNTSILKSKSKHQQLDTRLATAKQKLQLAKKEGKISDKDYQLKMEKIAKATLMSKSLKMKLQKGAN